MLVEIGDRIVNTDHIVTVKPAPSATDGGRSMVEMAGGGSFPVGSGEFDAEGLCGVIVPAQPGFVLIEAFLPGPGEEDQSILYHEKAVIAFRVIDGSTVPRPITLTGEQLDSLNEPWSVRQPDGRCVSFEGLCMAVEDFKADCERRASRHAPAAA